MPHATAYFSPLSVSLSPGWSQIYLGRFVGRLMSSGRSRAVGFPCFEGDDGSLGCDGVLSIVLSRVVAGCTSAATKLNE
ncbi:hypothetical protein CC86DRAFT_128573 [Ophiobolus disseminans]|uniref:Uncharacterized protein n=1 Tax=Ophiobolus disseminans TaxID=1469910 RepID=A0A6A6ZHS8_9PLEO|nr:hypothetical protein CC86DRAFT_128573 [Ophiobolus disseminans]